jgi:cobalt-zinc-cadmium efflux system outer membrane protein
MKHTILKLLSLAIGPAFAALASLTAGEAQTNQIAVDDLVSQALRENLELNSYRVEIAAAKGGLRTAETIANPELSAHAGYKNALESAGKLLGEGAAWSLSINQTLEYPGRVALRKAIANRDIRLAELRLEQFRATLAARVRAFAYQVLIGQERMAAAREVAERFQSLTEVLAQREPAGPAPLLETRIIEASTVNLDRQSRAAALAAKTIELELNQLLGQPMSALAPVRSEALTFRAPSLELLLASARTHAFELRIRQAELEQQGFKVLLAKNEGYPAVSVGPYFSREQAAETEYQAGIGISVPLPFWNRNAGNIEMSKARAQQAQASLLVTQREVERRVREAALTLQTKRDELSEPAADGMKKFREAAEFADRNFRLGAVPLSTYIESQKQYLEAIGAVFEIKKDALQAAQELEILTGQKFYVRGSNEKDSQP